MIKLNELNQKIKENKWLIAAILFFILWKFFLIHTLWQDRSIPPEPDDSYNYITQIASIAGCNSNGCPTTISLQNSSGFAYLSYRLFFGILAKITGLSPQVTYHLSFYIGTTLLALFLPFFLRIFSANKDLIAWTIFFLSFYHGLGETHGFFWVVPSFFLVLLLLLLFTFVTQEKQKIHPWLIGAIATIYTFSHPMSIFLVAILPLYLIFLNLFTSRISWIAWKRTFIVLLVVFSTSLVSSHTFLNKSPKENSYSIRAVITQIEPSAFNTTSLRTFQTTEVAQESSLFSKYQPLLKEKARTLYQTYFRWLLPSWVLIIPFLLGFFILLYKREIEIISLYFATFFFFLATTILDSLGYRTAILLWPVTYIFFAFSSWHFIDILLEKTSDWIRITFVSIFFLFLTVFFLINGAFAFLFNENINIRNNYAIEPELIQYLESLPPEKTITFSKEFVIAEMWDTPSVISRSVHLTMSPDYVITTNFDSIKEKPHSAFSQKVRRIATKLGIPLSPTPKQPPSLLFPDYVLDRESGVFSLHKRLP